MRLSLAVSLSVVVLLVLSNACSAGLIGSFSTSITGWIGAAGPLDCRMNMFTSAPNSQVPLVTIFNGPDTKTWDDSGPDMFANAGCTIWVSGNDDDPEFSALVDQITDGEPGILWLCGYGLVGMNLRVRFDEVLGRGYDPSIVDLQGYTIDRIGIRVDSASQWSDGPNSSRYSMSLTYLFEYDPVPEPATLLMLLVGLVGFSVFRPCRSRRID